MTSLRSLLAPFRGRSSRARSARLALTIALFVGFSVACAYTTGATHVVLRVAVYAAAFTCGSTISVASHRRRMAGI